MRRVKVEVGLVGRRYCFYLTPAMVGRDGYLPQVVVEGVAGTRRIAKGAAWAEPAWWGKDFAEARRRVEQANARLGIDPAQARKIVFSAAAAAFAEDAEQGPTSGDRPAGPTV